MTWRLPDRYCVSMTHLDGPGIVDESGKVWTTYGNAQIDTEQSLFGGASLRLDGIGDYADTPDHADWQLDGGSNSNLWDAELAFRLADDPGTGIVPVFQQIQDVSNFWAVYIQGNTLVIRIRSGGADIVSLNNAFNPAANTWYRAAVVKNGVSGYMMFIDGVQIGTTQTDTSPMPDFAGPLQIGRFTAATGAHTYLNGWIDEAIVLKGIARRTTNFTPSAKAYQPGGVIAHICG